MVRSWQLAAHYGINGILVTAPGGQRRRGGWAGRCAGGDRGGFTLIEVMFAVILLGIGFIMVAAMFPVAIQQSRGSSEETAASIVARSAMVQLSQVARENTMPVGAMGMPTFSPPLWLATRGDAIDQSDPRYAWVALYARKDRSSTAQVYIFVLQARNHSQFNLNDIEPKVPVTGDAWPASIQPKLVHIVAQQGTPNDRIWVLDENDQPMPAAAPGAYILSRDTGRLMRLGRSISLADGLWELAAGNDLPPDAANIVPLPPDNNPRQAYMVGRGYDPDTPGRNLTSPPQFSGPAMDIAVFTGFVKVK